MGETVPSGPGFSEERVHEGFCRVRNRLRKHCPEEVVSACINRLNQRPQDRVQYWRLYPPWRLLLLLKWTILYGDYVSPGRRRLTVPDFNYLVNLMGKIEAVLKLPSQHEALFLWFRRMAFQQFWLQPELNRTVFARQIALFDRLDGAHPFKRRFLEKCGITITQCLELSAALMVAGIGAGVHRTTAELLRGLAKGYERGAIESFLGLIAADLEHVRESLERERDSSLPVSLEYYENTPLRRTPLLRHGEAYFPFSLGLLARALETLVYDVLRDSDSELFMEEFGSAVFQQYVEGSIARLGVRTLNEEELRSILGPGKVVDYMCVDDTVRVLVDAKGVEMSYRGMVDDRAEVVKDRTKSSVLKGIEQGFETMARLRLRGNDKQVSVSGLEDYLLIVTFKDLFVGNGTVFHDSVATTKLDKLVALHGDKPPIPFEHMYFMSIEDFDLLVATVAAGRTSLATMLGYAVKADASPETARLTFGQHIREACPDAQPPEWLTHQLSALLDRCIAVR